MKSRKASWLQAVALLFPIIEYESKFVYPEDGSKKKTYQQVANELDIPKHQVASYVEQQLKTYNDGFNNRQ